jgi:putative transposase
MQLTHKIELKPTAEQEAYFKQAAGTARFTWNWALGEWHRQYQLGQKPTAMALKKQFNAIKYREYPWLNHMHRDSHAQAFAYLGKAWRRYFNELKSGKSAHEPRFKRKGRCVDSFYVANDKFRLEADDTVVLPKVGKVDVCETLRFPGKILGATVSRTANRWFIAIQVDVIEAKAYCQRNGHDVIGVDLGITAAAVLSTGEKIQSPKPLKSMLRRLQIRQRQLSRKVEAAKKAAGYSGKIPQGVRLPISNNRRKNTIQVSCLHARIRNIRHDFTHKLTTRLCRENQTIVIEDLNVKGMLSNEKLARSMSDLGFYEIRRQLEYKGIRYGTEIKIADRWYPSSRLCSSCGMKHETLKLHDRQWQCQNCGILHDRDLNAALNLKGLATQTALPVASILATSMR